jgi:hypothetical protein
MTGVVFGAISLLAGLAQLWVDFPGLVLRP